MQRAVKRGSLQESAVNRPVEADSFHRYGRREMRLPQAEAERAGDPDFSRFGPQNNLFAERELLFHSHAESGRGGTRRSLHDAVRTQDVDIARHPDLLIGVVPVINLESFIWRMMKRRKLALAAP